MYLWTWNLERYWRIYWWFGAPERQTRQGRHNRMCIQGSLCQLWQDVRRRNWKKVRGKANEHKTEVESKTKQAFTRSQRTAILTEYSKSALTDHANQASHTIDWKKTMVIYRTRPSYQVDQGSCTVHIRKEGHRAMNRDEGSYQFESRLYDRFLDATADHRIKTRKKWVPASSDEDLVMRSKR